MYLPKDTHTGSDVDFTWKDLHETTTMLVCFPESLDRVKQRLICVRVQCDEIFDLCTQVLKRVGVHYCCCCLTGTQYVSRHHKGAQFHCE